MSDNNEATPVARNKFPVGHPRYGGKKRNSTRRARELAEELGIDPLEALLLLIKAPAIEVAQTDPVTGDFILDADGKPKLTWIPIPLDVRLDAAKSAVRYIHPTLQATALASDYCDPAQMATPKLDIEAILAKPELLEAAQELAFFLIEAEDKADRHAPSPPPDNA